MAQQPVPGTRRPSIRFLILAAAQFVVAIWAMNSAYLYALVFYNNPQVGVPMGSIPAPMSIPVGTVIGYAVSAIFIALCIFNIVRVAVDVR